MSKKCVVVGVTGGIAAYKSAYLVRLLKQADYDVIVVMSENGARFVSPLTFETLSQNPVVTDTFEKAQTNYGNMEHISLSDRADLFVCAPATANFIGKIASGIADDILSTTVIALNPETPKLIFPAMNVNMYDNPVIKRNFELLRTYGYEVFQAESGFLACGVEARGRMAEPETIKMHCDKYLTENDLEGKRIIVTAGGTAEDIDPVRYITNRSTGKMGAEIAAAAWRRGARVTCICGDDVILPDTIDRVSIRSAEDMFMAVKKALDAEKHDFMVMAAAVADYTPENFSKEKIKKDDGGIELILKRTIDISAYTRDHYELPVIGFAAESCDLKENMRRKLETKGFSMIVGNDISTSDTGFASDMNDCVFMDSRGSLETGVKSKRAISEMICDYMTGRLDLG